MFVFQNRYLMISSMRRSVYVRAVEFESFMKERNYFTAAAD